jgi:Leucine Rich repeats (2 copies)
MTQEELAAVIEKAKKDRSTSLDLSRNQLTSLPESLYDLTSLKELNLSAKVTGILNGCWMKKMLRLERL